MARMRTLNSLFNEIHEMDPASSISRNLIRNLVLSKKIKSVKSGNKWICNLDDALAYFDNPPVDEETKPIYGIIRKING